MGLDDQRLWRRGGQLQMVPCLALVLEKLAMSSAEIKDTAGGMDVQWRWEG